MKFSYTYTIKVVIYIICLLLSFTLASLLIYGAVTNSTILLLAPLSFIAGSLLLILSIVALVVLIDDVRDYSFQDNSMKGI